MSSLLTLKVPEESSFHTSWEQIQLVLAQWSVLKKFNYRAVDKRPDRADYKCRQSMCNWMVKCNRGGDGVINMRIVDGAHSPACARQKDPTRKAVSSRLFLDWAIPTLLEINSDTT